MKSSNRDSVMVVEITPIGIQSLQWKFYIIWTIFNASFVPIVYLYVVALTPSLPIPTPHLFFPSSPLITHKKH